MFEFFRYMIAFRMDHPAVRRDLEPSYIGFPSMSIHGLTPWEPDAPESDYVSCVLFSGYDEENDREDLIYVAVNAHWNAAEMTLPDLPEGYCWKIAVNTGDPKQQTFAEKEMPYTQKHLLLGERSVIIFTGQRTK